MGNPKVDAKLVKRRPQGVRIHGPASNRDPRDDEAVVEELDSWRGLPVPGPPRRTPGAATSSGFAGEPFPYPWVYRWLDLLDPGNAGQWWDRGPRRGTRAAKSNSLPTSDLGDSGANRWTAKPPAGHDAMGSDSGGPEDRGPVVGRVPRQTPRGHPAHLVPPSAANGRLNR
jgi:hypothetical protein